MGNHRMPSDPPETHHHIYSPLHGLVQLRIYPDGRMAMWDPDNSWWTPLNVRLPQPQREAA